MTGGQGKKLLQEKRADILALAERYGVTDVRLFGSVVRGDDRPDSDVDLVVNMKRGRDYFDLIDFKLDAEDTLGRKLDVVLEKTLYHLLRDRILNEARPL